MLDAITWLLAVELLGILAFPLCFVLFRRLPDRGITLAKPLALVLFSYVLWLAGLTQWVPNSQLTIIIILVLGAAVGGLVFRATAGRVIAFLKEEWRTLLVAEGIFLAFFLFWLGVTSEAPAISGTEKPMDFGFMNAVLQSRFFPPEDPWLAGHSINYYYFGHFMMAFVVKLTAVPSGVGYNLAVSLVPALAAIGSFGLLYNLIRLSGATKKAAIGFGLAAPVLVLLIGNLEGAMEFVHSQGWGSAGFWEWVGVKGLEGGSSASGGLPDGHFWWWRATRVIDTLDAGRSLDYTITEFPMFSFLLGDLHPHMMSLPFLILGLSLGLNVFRSDQSGLTWLRRYPFEALAAALFVGVLVFINAWDLPLMAAVFTVLVLAKSYGEGRGGLQPAVLDGAAVLIPIFAVGVLLFLPFYFTLSGQASGILPMQDVTARPFLFFLTMGLFTLIALTFLARQLFGLRWPAKEEGTAAGLTLAAVLAPLLVWAGIVMFLKSTSGGLSAAAGELGGRSILVIPGLAIAAAAGFSALQRLRQGREPTAAFPLLLIAVSFYLLAGTELFYIDDLFGGAHRRMNTVFKVYYQAWLLLGLAAVYGLYYWWAHRPEPDSGAESVRCRAGKWALRGTTYAWVGVIAALTAASAYYPVGAVLTRTGVLEQSHTLSDNTLDGLEFIRSEDPGEYAAIEWLRDEAQWGRIVEAVGDDYSDFGRISASTGLPTILGWKGHELQWRGTGRVFDGREDDVALIYQSRDGDEVRSLLQEYQVRYVYLGEREQRKYGDGGLERFDGFLKTAFANDTVIIYELVEG